jgi:DNA-binding CsgD family transcriptional regulator
MLCGDDDGANALILLVREQGAERFSEADVRVAGEILGPIAAYLERRREGTLAAPPEQIRTRSQAAFYVLNGAYEIEYCWQPEGGRSHFETDGAANAPRLEARIEETVRELTAAWSFESPLSLNDGVAVARTSYVIRVFPLRGLNGVRIGVSLERFKTRNAIRAAARDYELSRREIDVLGLLIEGRENREVAELLRIAPSTVNDHVKRMLVKTQSRNRAELVARALGWNGGT